MSSQDHRTIFITGASSGLGRATAKLFARAGKSLPPCANQRRKRHSVIFLAFS